MSAWPEIDSIIYAAANNFDALTGTFILEAESARELAGLEAPIEVLQALEARATEIGKKINFTVETVIIEEKACYKITWVPVDVKSR